LADNFNSCTEGKPVTVAIKQNTNEEYHSDLDVISSSMLSVFLGEDGTTFQEREFYDKFVARTKKSWDKDRRYLDIGTASHTAALEPKRFASEIAVLPPYIPRRAGKMWKVFEKENRGKLILSRTEFNTVNSIHDSLRREAANWLDEEGYVEHSIYWDDPETGLPCRCRPDKVIILDDLVMIVDIKTARLNTQTEFSANYRKYHYGLQEAHYCEGVENWLGRKPLFRFLVVQSSEDFVAKKYQSTDEQVMASRDIRRRALDRLAKLYETDWRDVA